MHIISQNYYLKGGSTLGIKMLLGQAVLRKRFITLATSSRSSHLEVASTAHAKARKRIRRSYARSEKRIRKLKSSVKVLKKSTESSDTSTHSRVNRTSSMNGWVVSNGKRDNRTQLRRQTTAAFHMMRFWAIHLQGIIVKLFFWKKECNGVRIRPVEHVGEFLSKTSKHFPKPLNH